MRGTYPFKKLHEDSSRQLEKRETWSWFPYLKKVCEQFNSVYNCWITDQVILLGNMSNDSQYHVQIEC